MKKELKATITNGEIAYYDISEYQTFIDKNEGKTISVTLDSNRQRSLDQNAYMWSGVYPALAEYGEDIMYWHNYFKCRLILPKMIGRPADMEKLIRLGKLYEIGSMLTTTNLKTGEFAKYLEDIRDIASKEFDVYILSPEEFKLLQKK
jgi:hypothetical protein